MAREEIPGATDPASYNFWVTEHIRFADLDLMGHVNNVAFTIYLESARAAFMFQTKFWVKGATRQNVVARVEVDYLRELLYPGEVRVGLRVLKVGNASFTIGQALFDKDGRCAATAVIVIARMDTKTRRATPLNEEERAELQPYLAPTA